MAYIPWDIIDLSCQLNDSLKFLMSQSSIHSDCNVNTPQQRCSIFFRYNTTQPIKMSVKILFHKCPADDS